MSDPDRRSRPHRFPPSRSALASLAFCLAMLARAPSARATAFDVQGFGPAGVAEVNARAARAEDGSAAFYSPGGLALGHGASLELTPMLGASALEVQGQHAPLEDSFGVGVAFDATVPFTGALAERVRFGFSGYFMPTSAMRLLTRAADAHFYPYYDNRTQRMVLLPALAFRLARGLGVGLGANVLAGVGGSADVRAGASGAPEPRIDELATTVLRAVAGVRFDPSPRVRLALVYRQRFSVASLVTTTADVGGVPLAVDVRVAQALFDPDTILLASSFDLGRASFEIDTSYAIWSAYEGPFVAVHAELPGVDVSSRLPSGLFRDVFSLRAAADYRVPVGEHRDVVLRGGAGFEPSILRFARQGRTNLVDGDKLLLGLGATLALRDVFPRPVRLGVGAGVHVLSAFEQRKKACAELPCPADSVPGPDGQNPGRGITNPGYPVLSAGGAFFTVSLGLGVDL